MIMNDNVYSLRWKDENRKGRSKMAMIVAELIRTLQDMDPAAEVCLAFQPTYPQGYSVDNVVEIGDKVWLTEGGGSREGARAAFRGRLVMTTREKIARFLAFADAGAEFTQLITEDPDLYWGTALRQVERNHYLALADEILKIVEEG